MENQKQLSFKEMCDNTSRANENEIACQKLTIDKETQELIAEIWG